MKFVLASLLGALLVSGQAALAKLCSKEAVEKKVAEVCDTLVKKGEGAKAGWPAGLMYENCGDNYAWVHDTNEDITMILHPTKPRLSGNSMKDQPDDKGNKVFGKMNEIAKANPGGGWLEYTIAKPGSEGSSAKLTYVKTCKLPDGKTWNVGSGIWKSDLN